VRWALAALVLAGCSTPSRVRVEIGLGADTQALSAGPASLSVFTSLGRLFENRQLNGKLPGDVVVLVDDDVGEVRALVKVTAGTSEAAGAGKVAVVRGKEVALPVTLSLGGLTDSDGDGIPDVIDDCPGTPDPAQNGCPDGGADLATSGDDLLDPLIDMAISPPDLTGVPCGNGTLDPGETCDDGVNNSDDPAVAATCTTLCIKRAPCGTVAGAKAKIDPATGHCYVAWPTAVAWEAGEKDCLTRGGHLAAITSKAEDDLVKALIAATPSWIGVTKAPAASPVVWSNGESNAYGNFAAGGQGMGAAACVVSQPGGWVDRECSWPAVGVLPPVTINNAAYVCEHACGNGVMEPGEECDPPAAGSCTNACRKVRACTEAGGKTSSATGFCYFEAQAATPVNYTTALAAATCPAGTHLATPNNPIDTDTVRLAITADAWIAVSAQVTAQAFGFDVAGPTLDLKRYHGFAAPDPDMVAAPQCVVMSYMHATADGWRDRACTTLYPVVCERDN
jgi:hypothetical protein